MVGDDTGLAKEDNPYFCPGILTVLFDTYLAIFPLWSGLLLGDLSRYECHEQDMVGTKKLPKTRDTNCHIERWFGIVKHSIMHKEKKVKPGTFIRKMHKTLQARYTEHIIKHELPQKLLCQPEEPLNIDQSQETWKKGEERFRSTKSKYFSVPQNMPSPQKKRFKKDLTQSMEASSSDACQLPAKVLPVEKEMAKKVVEKFPNIPDINIAPSKEMMCHYRENVAKDKLLASGSKEDYCSVCGRFEIPPTEEQCSKCEHKEIRYKEDQCSGCGDKEICQAEELCNWIQCEFCLKWFHLQCLKMTLPPGEHPWICGLCS